MANSNKPFGFRPHSTLNAASYTGQIRKFFVDASDSTAFYVGDPVILDGTEGNLYVNDHPVAGVTKAGTATTEEIVGICVGVEPLYSDLELKYRKASTGMYVFVDTDPNTVYEVQGDSDTYATADIGLNTNFALSSGSTTTGVSNAVWDQDTVATTTTLPFKIIGSSPAPDNDVSTSAVYPRVLVKINNHAFGNVTQGA